MRPSGGGRLADAFRDDTFDAGECDRPGPLQSHSEHRARHRSRTAGPADRPRRPTASRPRLAGERERPSSRPARSTPPAASSGRSRPLPEDVTIFRSFRPGRLPIALALLLGLSLTIHLAIHLVLG